MAKDRNNKQISITPQTSEKLDKVKALFWVAKGVKPTSDLIVDFLAEQALENFKKNEKA
jgi:hypothetical protein